MQRGENLSNLSGDLLKTLKRFCIVVLFGIAFGYIEAAVVVYLRTIFYPAGFAFPLVDFGATPLWRQHLLIEIGREAATLVVIITGARLFGQNLRQRLAYFLTIFAIWDIFYYVWLKVFLNWPASIMDWDTLFLIPLPWAAPVLAPVLVSLTMFLFAVIILYRDCTARPIRVTGVDWLGFTLAALVVVASFLIAGLYMTRPDFRSHFYWWLFALGEISAVLLFINCLLKS